MKSKYNSLSEWRKADPKAYNAAFREDKLSEICEQFGWEYKPNNKNVVTKFLSDSIDANKNKTTEVLKRFYEKLKFIIDNDLVIGTKNHGRIISRISVSIFNNITDFKLLYPNFDGYGCYFWDDMYKDGYSYILSIYIEPCEIMKGMIAITIQSDLRNEMDEEYQNVFDEEIIKYNEIVNNFIKASESKDFIFKF